MESSSSSPSSSLKPIINLKAVDEAFERMFGYAWGTSLPTPATETETTTTTSGQQLQEVFNNDLLQIFGSKRKVAQILRLRLPTTTAISSGNNDNKVVSLTPIVDAARLLTRRTGRNVMNSNKKRNSNWLTSSFSDVTTSNDESNRKFQRRRLEKNDYKDIVLPNDVVSSDDVVVTSSTAVVSNSTVSAQGNVANNAKASSTTTITSNKGKTSNNTAGNSSSSSASKLDSVLQQLAGPKKQNTIEKTNNDWESFKGTDKALQDDLEKTAQSKDAYLVKQDFLQRVDQRRFEIERTERDHERARQAAASGRK
jgi:hypothetical protein